MARCARCAQERIRVFGGIPLRPAVLVMLSYAVLMTLFRLGYVYLRHRPGDWAMYAPTVAANALMFHWAWAAMGHSRHEQMPRWRLWAPVVAKSALALGLLSAWAVVLFNLGR